jgi:hypothetical protein
METGRRSVLVAALSTYADLLAKSSSELSLGQGKGKGKASDDDVDLEAERFDQLNLCGELNAEATSRKDKPKAHENGSSRPRSVIPEGFSQDWHTSKALFSSGLKRHTAMPQLEEPPEEYIDPFTGFPIIQETGFEPGPSSRPPRPMRNYSWRPASPEREVSKHQSKASASLARAASLPTERNAREKFSTTKPSSNLEMNPSTAQSHQANEPFQPSRDVRRTSQKLDERSPVEARDNPNPVSVRFQYFCVFKIALKLTFYRSIVTWAVYLISPRKHSGPPWIC